MNRRLLLLAGCIVWPLAGCHREMVRDDARLDRMEVSGTRVAGAVEQPKPLPPPPAAMEAAAPMPVGAPPPPPPMAIRQRGVIVDAPMPQGIRAETRTLTAVAEQPFSTFSIDVDTGSYTRSRLALRNGRMPSPAEVRAEEFLNYFDYDYPKPSSALPPFSLTTEAAPAPWAPAHTLLLIGIKGFEPQRTALPPSNLVFLIDTSGSMQSPDKLPLLKQAFADLVEQLRPQDRVAIVAYAGSAGLVLPATPGSDQRSILDALDRLEAGGSTAGGAGIELAYDVATRQFIRGGINRVILATDGDFNVGPSSVDALKALIADKRRTGVALTTLGFGGYGYDDAVAEQLADTGNGNHAFIDDELEARKVLVRELGGTLLTIAKDVKIQLEFNPAEVLEYRLLGYDNRALARQDFADDTVDAGEIGAGHDVTALYELVLAPGGGAGRNADSDTAFAAGELARLRLRYKQPEQEQSRLLEARVQRRDIAATPPPRLAFAAAVVGFAEKLRSSADVGTIGYRELAELARNAQLPDPHGERAELIDLIELADTLPPIMY